MCLRFPNQNFIFKSSQQSFFSWEDSANLYVWSADDGIDGEICGGGRVVIVDATLTVSD